MTSGPVGASALDMARKVLHREATALQAVVDRFEQDSSSFQAALSMALERIGRGGKLVFVGVGKSGAYLANQGIIAHKIASMLTSMGTLSLFMHPSEALHGDLGMLSERDVLVLVSYSGESPEIIALLRAGRVQGCARIAMCGKQESTIVRACDAWLNCSVPTDEQPHHEAWDEMPVPTCSSTATLAIGDAFAVALTHARGIEDAISS
ncbi:hypothetical protein MCUN1_002761 [Malassezia cuniculi]|uniref:SIS domain-containing protein n=1 Tax=Malassezia cuniculi TaxID=948313 RepID=A0AAF0J759_9BASI|nr:hypothetical protein MCUN1_002761 [Malassezia cuniculi]